MRPPVFSYPASEFLIAEFLESDNSPPRDLPIFYNYLCKNLPEKGKFIYYNIEQLTRHGEKHKILHLWSSGRIEEVWDYSKINCDILSKLRIPCKYVPFTLTTKRLKQYKTLKNVKKEFDVGFCGIFSDRRLNIIEERKTCENSCSYSDFW